MGRARKVCLLCSVCTEASLGLHHQQPVKQCPELGHLGKKKDNPCQLDFVMKSLARIDAEGLDDSCESPTHWQFHILRQKQEAIRQALVVASAKPRVFA